MRQIICTNEMNLLFLQADSCFAKNLELKIDQSANAALQQIEQKQYAAAFAGDHRRLYKIGVSFSSETRRVNEWKIAQQADYLIFSINRRLITKW